MLELDGLLRTSGRRPNTDHSGRLTKCPLALVFFSHSLESEHRYMVLELTDFSHSTKSWGFFRAAFWFVFDCELKLFEYQMSGCNYSVI